MVLLKDGKAGLAHMVDWASSSSAARCCVLRLANEASDLTHKRSLIARLE